MCGINALISTNSNSVDIIKKMNIDLSHRGFDNDGVYKDNFVSFGHRRLSIIDLSKESNQPMLSVDENIVLLFNGEIYNYRELKEKTPYPYRTNSDSEVIIALYLKFGKDFVKYLDGMFSLIIFDNANNKLVIARDRLGIKPLYYYWGSDFLLISSEIRPMIRSGLFKAKIDSESLKEYCIYKTVYAPNTIVKNVRMQSAGSIAEVRIDEVIKGKEEGRVLPEMNYWNIGDKSSVDSPKTIDEAEASIKKLFIESVDKRLISDVKLGAFLSGGIDSTAVVGVMSKLMNKKVETFTIDFAEEKYSESKYARIVAKEFNTNHHEIKLSPQYFLDNLDEALDAMDHPSEDGLNTYFVSKVTKEAGLSVALSGLGGDELFAGYYVFDILKKMEKMKGIWSAPTFMKKAFLYYRNQYKKGMVSEILSYALLKKQFSFKDAHQAFRRSLSENEIKTLFNSEFSYRDLKYTNFDDSHHLSTISSLEISSYMQNILLPDVDKMSMASTLEVRVPFLDHDFVNYVMSIPDELKGYNKKLFISSLKEYLPDTIVNRPKMGFVIPITYWLKNELRGWAQTKMNSLAEREGLDAVFINSLWNSFIEENNGESYNKVWHLIVLEQWLSKNID